MTTDDAVELRLTLTSDPEVDVGYLRPVPDGSRRAVATTVPIRDADGRVYGALDLDADGALVGIELLDLRRRLPGAPGG